MTHGAEPRPDPWHKDGEPMGARPVPGPFPAPPYPSGPPAAPSLPAAGPQAWSGATPGYPAPDPNAPAWARQAHAQGAYQPPPQPPAGHVQPMFPPTAQQQPYQQPGYLPPGYGQLPPPGPYPPGYQPGYPAPGYAAGPVKPGVVTAAAVLAYVQAGLLVIGALVSFAGARVLADLDVSVDGPGLLTILGVLGLAAAGLLIAGGVAVHHRRATLLIAGCAVSLALSAWWLIVLAQGSAAFTMPLVFAVLPIIALCLVLGAAARTWTRPGPGSH